MPPFNQKMFDKLRGKFEDGTLKGKGLRRFQNMQLRADKMAARADAATPQIEPTPAFALADSVQDAFNMRGEILSQPPALTPQDQLVPHAPGGAAAQERHRQRIADLHEQMQAGDISPQDFAQGAAAAQAEWTALNPAQEEHSSNLTFDSQHAALQDMHNRGDIPTSEFHQRLQQVNDQYPAQSPGSRDERTTRLAEAAAFSQREQIAMESIGTIVADSSFRSERTPLSPAEAVDWLREKGGPNTVTSSEPVLVSVRDLFPSAGADEFEVVDMNAMNPEQLFNARVQLNRSGREQAAALRKTQFDNRRLDAELAQ